MNITFRHTIAAVISAAAVWLTFASAMATPSRHEPATPPPQPADQAAQDDIIDIRGPVHIEAEAPWLPWIAAAIGVGAMGYTGWILMRRPRRILPYQLALQQLEQTRPLMQPQTVQAFSLAVSEVVRSFIESAFPLRAAHQTTEEFLRLLSATADGPLASHRAELGRFLDHCDLAKFARWSLTPSEMESLLDSARQFVIAVGTAPSSSPRSAYAALKTGGLSPAHP